MGRPVFILVLACLSAALLPPGQPSVPWLTGLAPPGASIRLAGTDFVARAGHDGLFSLPGGGRWTASLPGHFIAGAEACNGVRLQPKAHPAVDDVGYTWVDPTPGQAGACGNCHRTAYAGWKSSSHAHSASGADFQRYYARLYEDKPDGAGVCTSCHAPGLSDDDPAFFDLRQIRGATSGIHCDYCHKITDLHPGEIGLTHGRFLLKLMRTREGQVFFGPLDDVDRGEDVYSPLYRDSRYCAACHEGNVFGVSVYTTYSEWQASPAGRAGQQCQDCHSIRHGRSTPHTFWQGDQLSMLRRCVEWEVGFGKAVAEIRLTARNVGHRVPTGFIERTLLLEVEVLDANEAVLHRYTNRFTRAMAGPFWQTDADSDTRLLPEVPWVTRIQLPPGTQSVRTRLSHHRFQTEPVRASVVKEHVWPRFTRSSPSRGGS
jgi:hypothetical protein